MDSVSDSLIPSLPPGANKRLLTRTSPLLPLLFPIIPRVFGSDTSKNGVLFQSGDKSHSHLCFGLNFFLSPFLYRHYHHVDQLDYLSHLNCF